MIKKLSAILLCALFVICAAVPAFAGQDDAAIAGATLDLLYEFDLLEEFNGFQMRGFTASPDGRYFYGGFLQNYRHVTKIDANTLERVAEYMPEIENDDGVGAESNYPKGLAVDCRGYLFVGITHDVPQTPYISLACVDSEMNEVSYITEKLDGDHTGINGVAAQKIGEKILVYVSTCYDKDTIRCYDVTDVNNMKLNEEFGVGGVVDYNELTGSQKDPGYIAVDVDGYVYLCYLAAGSSCSKGSTVVKIAQDGKSIVESAEVNEAYGICTAGDYVFVSTHDGADSKVVVLNKADLSKVGEIKYEDQETPLSGIAYGGGYLFVGDHGNNGNPPGRVLRTNALNITRDERETATVDTQPTVKETEPAATEAPKEATNEFVLADFTNPDVVAKLGGAGNDCTLEYDEANDCLKITVTGPDPFFNIPMSKATYFMAEDYSDLVIVYKTDEYVNGEIFYTTKTQRDIVSNHLMYEMEDSAAFTEVVIDMYENDSDTWESQVRTLRIDPVHDGEEGMVFYFKSVAMRKAAEPESTEAPATAAPETKAPETKAPDTKAPETKAPETKAPTTDPKSNDSNTGLIIGIIAGVVVIAAAVVVVLVILKKKKA